MLSTSLATKHKQAGSVVLTDGRFWAARVAVTVEWQSSRVRAAAVGPKFTQTAQPQTTAEQGDTSQAVCAHAVGLGHTRASSRPRHRHNRRHARATAHETMHRVCDRCCGVPQQHPSVKQAQQFSRARTLLCGRVHACCMNRTPVSARAALSATVMCASQQPGKAARRGLDGAGKGCVRAMQARGAAQPALAARGEAETVVHAAHKNMLPQHMVHAAMQVRR